MKEHADLLIADCRSGILEGTEFGDTEEEELGPGIPYHGICILFSKT